MEFLEPTCKFELPAYDGLMWRGPVPICFSSYAALAGLELEMILPLPTKYWDYRHALHTHFIGAGDPSKGFKPTRQALDQLI